MKYLTSHGLGVDKNLLIPLLLKTRFKSGTRAYFHCRLLLALVMQCFFYNGKTFAFRGMEEHRQCTAEQFQIGTDHENNHKFLKYMPRITKNVQGGLKHRRIEISPVTQYDDPTNPRCLVRLYETYLSLIPGKGPFYRKPLETVSSFGTRFSASSFPVNQMLLMYKRFYAEAGLTTTGRNISNNSGRVTCCTTLYNKGFTDKAVTSRSHHRNNAVHSYQREQFQILRDISNTLGASRPNEKPEVSSEVVLDPDKKPKTNSAVQAPTASNALHLHLPDNVTQVIIIKGEKKIELVI